MKKIVIAGGGTAGWMSAAALARALGDSECEIVLVESEEIGTVGVGEATIPSIKGFNDSLGIAEDEFLRETKGTFKLGIDFINWGRKDHSYFHPFGKYGVTLGIVPFHNYWLKASLSFAQPPLEAYSMCAVAARQGKFAPPVRKPNTPLADITYAYHFDAGLYAKFLRGYAEGRGVKRVEGKIASVNLCDESGRIDSLTLDCKTELEADFYVDCTGFRGMLIGEALGVGYESWSDWLLCDRAVAVQSENDRAPVPYTKSTAHQCGWQWKIPLQHRCGNGHVYASDHMSTDEATSILLNNLDGPAASEPKHIKFSPGVRKKCWEKNCVAVGLSSGFLEPLESTSIYLIQQAIARLVDFFPEGDMSSSNLLAKKFNERMSQEYEDARDFIILHYKVSSRDDSKFWDHCRTMTVPDRLQEKLELFKNSGILHREKLECFTEESWVTVMCGQGLMPDHCHPMANSISDQKLERYLGEIRRVMSTASKTMPDHMDYVKRLLSYC